jgi:hypothetical protein
MYGTVQHEAWRQCPREMGQQLATIRLEKATRESGVKTPGLLRDLGWELARVAGLLDNRLRNAPAAHAEAESLSAERNQR